MCTKDRPCSAGQWTRSLLSHAHSLTVCFSPMSPGDQCPAGKGQAWSDIQTKALWQGTGRRSPSVQGNGQPANESSLLLPRMIA
eukprot:52069-Eustigmatos_ZCMA.PRE.1